MMEDMPEELAERLPPEERALRNAARLKTVAEVRRELEFAEGYLRDWAEEVREARREEENAAMFVRVLRARLAELQRRREGG